MNEIIINLSEYDEYIGERVDKALANILINNSRSYIQKLIKSKNISINNNFDIKPKLILQENDIIKINYPNDENNDIKPVNINLDILYEDNDILIINKPKNMPVHPSNSHFNDTLVNALLYKNIPLSNINGTLRPGIVHRLDMNTTGALIVCKNNSSHEHISNLLKNHNIKRSYIAICIGTPKNLTGKLETYISRSKKDRLKMAVSNNGKIAITNYTVLASNDKYSLIKCDLETGRTHQIRVHMAYLGTPILGDYVYGKTNTTYTSQCLHARTLGFIHPTTNNYIEFNAPLPEYFINFIKKHFKTQSENY